MAAVSSAPDGKENFLEFALVLKLNHVPVMAFKLKGQFYSKKYAEEFSFISSSAKSKQHAYCKNCRRDLSVAHEGHYELEFCNGGSYEEKEKEA